MSTPMLRQAVRAALADAGDRTPSPDAWGLVLVAAGVEPVKAAGLPARLGCVFHLGRWREPDVVRQLQAWADALRVRAEPDVAAVVDRAAAALAAEVASAPLPDPEPARTEPVRPAPAPAPVPPPEVPTPQPQQPQQQQQQQGPWTVLPPPAAGPRSAPRPDRPAPGRRGPDQPAPRPPQRRRPQQGGHPQQAPQPGPQQGQHPGQHPGQAVRPRPPRGKAPRTNRWVAFGGLAFLLLICGCGLFSMLGDLLGGNG